MVHHRIAIRLAASGLMAILALGLDAGTSMAAGNASCSVSGGETLVRYHAPGGPANDITFHLAGTHNCYEFINGDIGVVGPVTVTRIQPDHYSGCTGGGFCAHGWMRGVSATRSGGQGFDSRDSSFDPARFGGALPTTISGPASVVKAKSDTVNSCPGNIPGAECLDYAAVLTILDAAPADAPNTFRPAVHVSTPRIADTPTWGQLDWSGTSRLDASQVANVPTFQAIKRRFEELQLEAVQNYQGRKFHPEDNYQKEEYHGKIADTNAAAVLRFALDDVDLSNPAHKAAAAAVIQAGYDLAWMYHKGGFWNDHSNGRQIIAAFAADLTGDPQLIDAVRSTAHNDRENAMTYHSAVAGRALFGASCTENAYWTYYRNHTGTKFCRDPYGFIDGPEVYQSCCLHAFTASALAAIVTGVQPTFNRPSLMDYAYRRYSFGLWTSPDPCKAASAGGGPDGSGSCIKGSPSRDVDDPQGASHGGNRDKIIGNTGMFHGFVQSMKNTYFDCAVGGTCAGQGAGGQGGDPSALPAPYLL